MLNFYKPILFFILLFILSCDSSSSPTSPTGGAKSICSDIVGEWDGVTYDRDIINDTACTGAADFEGADYSYSNWEFESGSEYEENNSNGSTQSGFYECIADDELKTCDDESLTQNCTTYSLIISDSNLTLDKDDL